MEMLSNCPWRGNVRELANLIERAVIVTRGEELQVPLTMLPTSSDTGLPVQVGLALVPIVIYSLLGSSRVLSVSTTTTVGNPHRRSVGTGGPQWRARCPADEFCSDIGFPEIAPELHNGSALEQMLTGSSKRIKKE